MASLLAFDGGLTLLAPAVAIGAALLTKRVLPSLASGAVVGAFVAKEGDIIETVVAMGVYVLGAIGFSEGDAGWGFSWDHVTISAFSLLVAAMVGVLGAAGATQSLVERLEGVARGRRGAMVASWLAGMVVFFDDYANCLVVGKSMGPLYDRFRVSRAKLAYIVDSTAAPIASLALVSTWVGYEVGLVQDALIEAGSDASAFSVFLSALPYRFYSIFTLAFVAAIAFTGRDFGPMVEAEEHAGEHPPPKVEEVYEQQAPPWVALLPVISLVGLTFLLMVVDGRSALGDAASGARLFEILGEADPYQAMFRGSLMAFALAGILVMATGALTFKGFSDATVTGMREVLHALAILYCAWTLGNAIGDTNAAGFMTGVLGDAVPLFLIPTVTFLLAAGTAFATGTSFGTMGILIPLAVPLSVSLSGGEIDYLVYSSTAAVLAGACLGDHASPISDTTVLSALGAGVDVITHVRTQLPYALTTGVLSLVFGYIPAGLGVSVWLLLLPGMIAALVIVLAVGRVPNIPDAPVEVATESA